jgi:hypothetical protein
MSLSARKHKMRDQVAKAVTLTLATFTRFAVDAASTRHQRDFIFRRCSNTWTSRVLASLWPPDVDIEQLYPQAMSEF